MNPVIIAYGAGLDSFEMLRQGIERGEHIDAIAFCDVADVQHQDPGEWPSTYRHFEEIVRPLCAEHGIEVVVIDSERYPVRDARSLFAWMKDRGQIPVSGPNRICTTVAKVERFEAWLDDRFPGQEVTVWVGFEAGEEARAENDPNAGNDVRLAIAKVDALLAAASKPAQIAKLTERLERLRAKAIRTNRFPLIEWGACRCRCEENVRAAGYPVPRKSACVFCPYGTKGDFQTLARELPEQFDAVVELEAAKPPTSNGAKLSIKNFRTVTKADGTKVYKPTMLPDLVKGTYRKPVKPCGVCGRTEKATKATGCDYLGGAAEVGHDSHGILSI